MGTGETFIFYGLDFITGWRRENGPEICEFLAELQCVSLYLKLPN
jgi:hypothetical protein